MAHYLYINSKADRLRLDSSTNPDALSEELSAAEESGATVGLNAYVGNEDVPAWVKVNPSRAAWWTVEWVGEADADPRR